MELGSIYFDKKPLDIVFKDVTYTVKTGKIKKKEKVILKEVSGNFRSGELTAIMGPSGAGKSTLLNILTGLYDVGVSGLITAVDVSQRNIPIDEKIPKKNSNKICRKTSCYIMQDDQLCPLFSVNEIMYMACNFKLGYSVSTSRKNNLIRDILEKLGLSNVANTRCSMLSGGQKKRLSIALELIDNPPMMFLDEPTTGLDSSSSSMCISILRNLSRMGRIIVCTIHQPSATVFEMFDHVYVIAEGHCVYQGSCHNVVPFLQTVGLNCPQYHNPADFLLEVVNGEYGHFTTQLTSIASNGGWRSSSAGLCNESNNTFITDISQMNEKPIKNGYSRSSVSFKSPSEFYRFFTLVHRCIIKLYRDWTVSHLKMILHFFVGILLGLLYSKCGVDGSKSFYNVGFLIVSLVYLSYTSLMPAILKFPAELNTLRKEEFNNWYNLSTFYIAFLITNIPVQMMFCFIYAAVSYYLSSQIPIMSRFVMFVIVCQLITLTSEGFGLILGTCFSPVNGVFIGAVMTCFFILFAGYVVLFAHMPTMLYYVSFSSYFRYGFEGLVAAVYGGGRGALECPTHLQYCHYKFPQKIFEELSMKEERYLFDVSMLFVFFLAFISISFYTLKKRLKVIGK